MHLGFFFSLDRNVEDVDHFYNKKYAEYARRLKLLEERYGYSIRAGHPKTQVNAMNDHLLFQQPELALCPLYKA